MQPPARAPVESFVTCGPDGPLVYERLSDAILVRRTKDGDERALETLCARHAERIHRIALHVLRDPDDAATRRRSRSLKLMRRVHQFRGESLFSTWLHRLVVNTCKDVAQARWAAARGEPSRSSRTCGSRWTAIPHVARSLGEPARARRRLAELPQGAGDRRRAEGRVRRAVRRDLRRRRACPSARRSATPTAGGTGCGSGCLHDRSGVTEGPDRQGRDRGGPAAPRPDAADRRGARARARASGCVARKTVTRRGLCRPLSRQPDHARREDGRGARAVRCRRGAVAAREPRQARPLRRHRRRALQARRAARRDAALECDVESGPRPGRPRQGARRPSTASSPCAAR